MRRTRRDEEEPRKILVRLSHGALSLRFQPNRRASYLRGYPFSCAASFSASQHRKKGAFTPSSRIPDSLRIGCKGWPYEGPNVRLASLLPFERCPHCGIAKPNIVQVSPNTIVGTRQWTLHACQSCFNCVMSVSPNVQVTDITKSWPDAATAPTQLPARAREYFEQAIASLATPVGAIVLMASSIDSMLKNKGLANGTLYARIDEAAKTHLITDEMAAWAHEIRLDANDQRHADESAPLPTVEDAEKVVEFGKALAQFLYVLPARVARGRGKP